MGFFILWLDRIVEEEEKSEGFISYLGPILSFILNREKRE